ncbi:hypothetical protein Ahy_Scaffold1g107423 [Arachis hypogaea]|uniref:Uncharacterized protein n=1 Tax=Arachis hypogaea TaxID=3818 RepID=A0A444WVR8_ARAHY|nr:hypothetical protein Ahy_Scaffold1g107423 [Arachis hypogaea]
MQEVQREARLKRKLILKDKENTKRTTIQENSSDGSNDVHFQSVLSNITNGLNIGITCEACDSPCHQTSQQHFQQTSNNIHQLQSQHSLEYSNRIRLQRDARLNRKTMLLQKRQVLDLLSLMITGASTSNSNLDTKELEEVCIAEKGRHLRQRKTFLKELAINLSKIFEVEDITENMTILDDSVQIEYPAIFDVAENTGLNMTDDELKNLCLIEIEKILNSNVRSLRDYQSMPYPEMSHYISHHNLSTITFILIFFPASPDQDCIDQKLRPEAFFSDPDPYL